MIITMAWRNVWRNKMRSLVIMLSVSIGLFAGIAVLALYKGMLKSRVRTVIDAETGHLQVHERRFKKDLEPRYTIPRGDAIMHSISTMPAVKLVAPRIITPGMLATATGSAGVQINDITPRLEYQASQLNKKIVEGKQFDSVKKNEIIIGKKLARKMKIKPGSKLILTFTDSSGTLVSGAFRVAGIYESANAPLDARNVYVTITDLGILLATGNSFHEIIVLLNKDEETDAIVQQLRTEFPNQSVESWKEISPETYLMVKTTDQYSYIIMIIIMFALAFGIVNTMLMAILERTKEIGMMVALGTTRFKVFLLVLCETLFLTLAGTPFGLLSAWLSILFFNAKGLDLSGMGREMMSSFGFDTTIYPEFPTDKLVNVMTIVFLTAFISCLLPAAKALKLQPVEALRR